MNKITQFLWYISFGFVTFGCALMTDISNMSLLWAMFSGMTFVIAVFFLED